MVLDRYELISYVRHRRIF
uniref:Uncharacterized protein n=1 Tax=Arundo donax TaxID=35708 RepID=A0A0A9GLQ5_ARUDO